MLLERPCFRENVSQPITPKTITVAKTARNPRWNKLGVFILR
jgi:hypothetical protein